MGKMTYKEWENRYLAEEGSNYDRDFRFKFVNDYLLDPNLAKVARSHNVPYQTAVTWKSKEWWHSMAEEILQNHKDDVLSRQRRIIEKTYGEIEDRLENGDEMFDKEVGHVRVKVKANHLATIADTTLKANQLLSGKATQISHVTIEGLADKLRDITLKAQEKDITPKSDILTVDFIETSESLEPPQNQQES
jgi:hypothetical protein